MKFKNDSLILQTISATFSEGLYWKDRDGYYVECNDYFAQLVGLTRKAIIGKKDEALFPKKETEDFSCTDKRAMHENKTLAVRHSLLLEQERQILLFKKTPLRDEQGEVIGLLGMVRKIEACENNSLLSKETEGTPGFLEDIIAMIPMHIYWQDSDNIFLGCNDLQARTAGLQSRHEIIGKSNNEMPWSSQADALNKINDEVRKTEKPHTVEEVAKVANGEIRTFFSKKAPLYNENKEVVGIVGISLDITDRKRAEALEKEKAALERDNAIHAMKIETMRRFCRKLLHDIRSPLSTLRMLITVLCKATLDGDFTINLVRIRATAYRCIRRIEAMANSFLRKYRQEEGSEEDLPPEPTLLMPLVVDALLEKRSTLSMEDIKLQQEMKGAYSLSSTVECFELVQIFSNLINNSAEAIVEKREKIGDKKAEGLVRFKMTERKEHIHFAISDNGCGIPQNLLEEIFKKDKTTKKEGSGIGLFHAREGIDSWGGKIWAESKEGQGSTMNILLPKAEAPPQWFAAQIEVPKNGILVVADDEPHLHHTMKACLEEHGLSGDIRLVEINTLSKFTEWYEEHKEENPVILMDYLFYNEQKRTGLDAIKENEVRNAIIVTNIYDDVFLRKECTEAGVKLIPKNIIDRIPIKVIEN